MIDLSEFAQIRARNSSGGCYIKRIGGRAKLVMERSVADDAVGYFGNDVRVLVDCPTGRVVLARGNDRRISMGDSGSPIVSIGSDEDFKARFGNFKRIYLEPSWESDQHHNKVLLFSPNGVVEEEYDTCVRKVVVDGRS